MPSFFSADEGNVHKTSITNITSLLITIIRIEMLFLSMSNILVSEPCCTHIFYINNKPLNMLQRITAQQSMLFFMRITTNSQRLHRAFHILESSFVYHLILDGVTHIGIHARCENDSVKHIKPLHRQCFRIDNRQ